MRFIKIAISILLTLPLLLFCVYAEEDFPVKVNAKAVLLMDTNTQTVILQKNGDEQLDVTTTVKTMSILLFMEALKGGQLSLDGSVQVSTNAAAAKGMQAFLEAGDSYSVRDLLKCVIMISANDACIALAEHMAGSEEAFVGKMNARAQELGLKNTAFSNCTGLRSEGQYSSARDLAVIACEALKHDTLFLWSKTYMDSILHAGDRMTELVNPNRLVRMYNGANGLQTGSSDSAGYSVVASAKRGETGYICVVIGSPNTQERFSAATALLDYGFANYEAVNITRQGETIKKSVPVKGGSVREVQIVAGETASALLEKGQAKSLIKELELPEQLEAPLTLDQPVGELVVKNGDQEIVRIPLFAKEEVEQRTFQYILLKILANWIA